MKYDDCLNKIIEENSNPKYAEFQSGLVPGIKIKGVKVPVLRSIAKQFSKFDDFLENVTLDNFEKISVACYYIGYTTKDIKTLSRRLEYILPYVDNWAVCDTFVSTLKILKTKNQEAYPVIEQYLKSTNDFTARFAVVCLLGYYINETNIVHLFEKIIPLQNRSYYLDMAIAWFVSVAFVKCRNQTLNLLKSNKLIKDVQNKSISKICDSFRVSTYDKEVVRALREK